MNQPPNDPDDLERVLKRMEGEFGPRRLPNDDTEQRGVRPSSGPIYGEAQRIPTPRLPAQRPQGARPQAVWVILGSIAVIYVVSCLLSGSLFEPNLGVLILLGAKENSLIAAGAYWRLITATLLHASLIHIFFNGYALFALGPESERIYGTGRFLALYALAGLGGSVASYLFSPATSVGASGAIFGLIGGLGMFFYLNRTALGEFGRAQTQSMASIAMINLIIGFASGGRIDNWGHFGGLVAGVIAGAALAPQLSIAPDLYPPVITRRYHTWGWMAAAALACVLAALVILLPGAR